MNGNKARALECWSRARGSALVRFDYFGHGSSDGAFRDGTIGRWLADSLDVIDHLTAGPQLLVGSSMGAWLMLLTAIQRPSRVAGMVGIASACDFTESLIWHKLDPDQRKKMMSDGFITRQSDSTDEPDIISRTLVEEGRNHLLLHQTIDIDCPVRLIHGARDSDVPWQTSLHISQRLVSSNVSLHLIKDADHRLSREQDIEFITDVIGGLIPES